MSTRAIVKVSDTTETWSLYCHGDGYPKYLGEKVKAFVELAPKIDPNNHDRYEQTEDYDPYRCVPNVSFEACKFAAAFAGYLWKEGYCGAYLTTRDAEKEKATEFTDIEYLYKVGLDGRGSVNVEVVKL